MKPAGAATNSGTRGAATNSGDAGAATNSGYAGAATNSGTRGAAIELNGTGKVRGVKGSALFLVERDENFNIIAVGSALVGKTKGIKADTWYSLKNGKFVEAK